MENKTLNTIQTVVKVIKTVSTIVFIFTIIGSLGSMIGLASLTFLKASTNIDLSLFISMEADMSVPTMIANLIGSFLTCIGIMIIAIMIKNYCVYELKEGQPFTLKGSKMLFKTGIYALVIPIVISFVTGIVATLIDHYVGVVDALEFDNQISLTLGISLIIISLLCKYGSERVNK